MMDTTQTFVDIVPTAHGLQVHAAHGSFSGSFADSIA